MPLSNQVVHDGVIGDRPMKRVLSLFGALAIFAAVLVAGSSGERTSVASASGCPNEAFRQGPSSSLPDCRAYEMVTPAEKNGADVVTLGEIFAFSTGLFQATPDGGKIAFASYKAFGDAKSSLYANQYIATRGATGWSTHAINAPRPDTIFGRELNFVYDQNTQVWGLSEDLSTAAVTDDAKPALTPDAAEDIPNLYARNNLADTYDWIGPLAKTPETVPIFSSDTFPYQPQIEAVSPTGDHIVFTSSLKMTDDALPSSENGSPQLYDYSGGELHLVSVLPDGTPAYGVAGDLRGYELAYFKKNRHQFVRNALSRDGRRITWSQLRNEGEIDIYQRIDNQVTKDVSHITGTGSAVYEGGSVDGTEVLYAQGSLYRANVDSQTATTIPGEAVVGASDDLAYIYVISKNVLDAGATAGEPNLYLFHNGDTRFVATLSPTDLTAGTASTVVNEEGQYSVSGYSLLQENPRFQAAQVTPDGLGLAFQSVASLTGYDNRDVKNNEPDLEVFAYDAERDELLCASCNPSGARPSGEPLLRYGDSDQLPAQNNGGPARRWTAAYLQTSENQTYYPRVLSDDGNRVFFNAYDSLVASDSNNRLDVYQWERQGTGTCTEAGGCISLISSGESARKSEFIDASRSGDDIFFKTQSSLVPQDPDLIDVYVAKVGGGFDPPTPVEAPCEGDACQNLPVAPNDPTPGSASYNGPGNVHEKAKKKHRKKHRKKKHHPKQGKKHKKNGHARAHGQSGARHTTHRNG